jgi:hypothetical protein
MVEICQSYYKTNKAENFERKRKRGACAGPAPCFDGPISRVQVSIFHQTVNTSRGLWDPSRCAHCRTNLKRPRAMETRPPGPFSVSRFFLLVPLTGPGLLSDSHRMFPVIAAAALVPFACGSYIQRCIARARRKRRKRRRATRRRTQAPIAIAWHEQCQCTAKLLYHAL